MSDMTSGVRGHNSPSSITSQLSKIVNLIAMEVDVNYDHDGGHVGGDEHEGVFTIIMADIPYLGTVSGVA